ncbi:MAG: helicase RepA family protein [Proteobacteria bacterium]|nr:helicase RepA family protein [Pseudomonadota bacterium]
MSSASSAVSDEARRIEAAVEARAEAERKEFEEKGRGQTDQQQTPPVPTWESASVARFLISRPPAPEYIFNAVIERGVIGGISAGGGTGKGFHAIHMGLAAATGVRFGPFNPPHPWRVFYLCAEDPENKLWDRVYRVAESMGLRGSDLLGSNMVAISTVGQVGPLIGLQDNAPVFLPGLDWLNATLTALAGDKPFDLLLLDPMSRLSQLEENNNAHGTAWIQLTERISHEHGGPAIIFCHHESKVARESDPRAAGGRGASSFFDGARWWAGLRRMNDKDGKKFSVNPRDYLVLDISKASYEAEWPAPTYYERGEGGILIPARLGLERLKRIAEALCDLLAEDASAGETYSRRDLTKTTKGAAVARKLTELVGGGVAITQSMDLANALDLAHGEGWLDLDTSGRKSTYRVTSTSPQGGAK